ncbi:MAG: RagB/SusD family nutrient uptake outer membrane protein [Phocaeicola sp.]|uniref:RagB/SusD family nutrient uptake outer membrane protein n=1 Tax=Phocaeicola TaxID=909656 RepID=UPI00234E69FD|nr:RagB/SusD family nutrient uptake outer membrane protein [Phocaeicola oris]MCE2616849.1 RagB/SusD family nutrient uptake outer membrane protein [Phocaeicola oris]
MKKIISMLFAVVIAGSLTTSCIEEYDPEGYKTDRGYILATNDQAAKAPGSFNNFVNTITSTLCGQFTYGGSSHYPYDFGYPSFFLMRDVMGNDIVAHGNNNWYSTWYACGTGLGPQYARCQIPWTYYYAWIKSCNTVLALAGENPDEEKMAGAGIAHAMRAMFYMDLARMFAQKTYAADKSAETVPLVTETTALTDLPNNPRATNEVMWAFILSDLDKAETELANYKRLDVYTPDITVVYGLKARAYLTMEDWANAQKYAKMAQNGYSLLTDAQYNDRKKGFNSPNESWMFACSFKSDNPNILENDADSSWGSIMISEVAASGCGYSANYGQNMLIDRHLYETIPATDFRKKAFIDFNIDSMDEKGQIAALADYTDDAKGMYNTGQGASPKGVGGITVKFRPNGGEHVNQALAFTVAVPLMRVEEMYLIEAEAAGMQSESAGVALLTTFAQTRDAKYEYGTHGAEAYYNNSTSKFQNEVWWQRRVELWGEGFATFDIKRLQKGIIRNYNGTYHLESNRWNIQSVPEWMNLCIIQTETNYNTACTNNPTPVKPTGDSDEYVW